MGTVRLSRPYWDMQEIAKVELKEIARNTQLPMLHSRLVAVPRLSRNALSRLIDMRASVAIRCAVPLHCNGTVVGYVEEAHWSKNRVILRGWSTASELRAGMEHQVGHNIQPWIERADIAARLVHAHLRTGFEVEIERDSSDKAVVVGRVDDDGKIGRVILPAPDPVHERLARLGAMLGALRFAIGHRRDILGFIRTGDPGLSVALRDAFGLGDNGSAAPIIPSDIFADQPVALPSPARPTVIIVPVFNASADVERLLERLKGTIDIAHHLIFVDDGSDDPRIQPMLSEFTRSCPDQTTVLTQDENRGFVAAVNRGLELSQQLGEHVIILNTDTLPPPGWASRLLAPILSDPDVASVTPLSNSAEIASLPAQSVETPLTEDQVYRIDGIARQFGPAWRQVAMPTGIGFAMAMNRRFLGIVGGFDTAFGRGYGEEVDWCQKARAAGGKNVLSTSVFVGHAGGASFGHEEKRKRVLSSAKILTSRYPGYDREVQEWARASPHEVQRAALTPAWLDAVTERPTPVFLAHVLGGGAEIALRREIDRVLSTGAPGAIVVRAGGSASWRIEFEGRDFRHGCRVLDSATVLKLLSPLRRRQVIYSCGAGARDPREVPELLLALSRGGEHALEMRLHDYYAISPSYCLLDSKGRYRGVPDESDRDPAHNLASISGRPATSLREWRSLWSKVVDGASRITTYSDSSTAVFTSVYGQASDRVMVAPHDAPPDIPDRIDHAGPCLGVLGGINRAKGADVLVALARHSTARRIVLIGGLDPNYRLHAPHRVVGKYDRRDISRLAKRHGIGLWLIPSIWPETFSFATREALATGLPVLTFNLGAQAEAARSAPNGHILDCPPTDVKAISTAIERHFREPMS